MVYFCTKITSKTQHADIISKRQDNVRQGGQKAGVCPTLPDRGRHSGCGNGKDGRGGIGSAAGLQQEDSGRELATIPELHGSREDACPACLQRSGIQASACCHLERRGIGVCPEASLDNVFPLWSASPYGRHCALSYGALRHDRSHKRQAN